MRIFILFLSLIMINCAHKSDRFPAMDDSKNQTKHFIFLIHGIGTSEKTFGYMPEALKSHLKYERPGQHFIIKTLNYQTSDNSLSVKDFSEELSSQIKKTIKENNGLEEDDLISFVTHSQGGLIGTYMLNESILGNNDYIPEMIKHIDTFITLGTPMWGAKISDIAANIKPSLDNHFDFSKWFGQKQLQDLRMNSQFIYALRQSVMNPTNQIILSEAYEKIQFVQFTGIASKLRPLAQIVGGSDQYEDDTAVPLVTANYNFIYYSDLLNAFQSSKILKNQFVKSTLADQFYIVDAIHDNASYSNLLEDEKYVPKQCINSSLEDCSHPTFSYIVKTLIHIPFENKFKFTPNTFLLNYNIKADRKIQLDPSKIKLEYVKTTSNIRLTALESLYNAKSELVDNQIRGYHFGYFKKDKTNHGVINMKVSYPGLKSKTIEVPIERGTSTFIELDLKQ